MLGKYVRGGRGAGEGGIVFQKKILLFPFPSVTGKSGIFKHSLI